MSVFKWIHAFKPQNINTNDLSLPAELAALDVHSKNLHQAVNNAIDAAVPHQLKTRMHPSPTARHKQPSVVSMSASFGSGDPAGSKNKMAMTNY